jgi:hypothetical protein
MLLLDSRSSFFVALDQIRPVGRGWRGAANRARSKARGARAGQLASRTELLASVAAIFLDDRILCWLHVARRKIEALFSSVRTAAAGTVERAATNNRAINPREDGIDRTAIGRRGIAISDRAICRARARNGMSAERRVVYTRPLSSVPSAP